MALESDKINFKIKRNNVIIDAVLYLDAENKEPLIFYDAEGLKYNKIPDNHYNKTDAKFNDYEILANSFEFDNMVLSLLLDYAEENNIHVILKDYELFINP